MLVVKILIGLIVLAVVIGLGVGVVKWASDDDVHPEGAAAAVVLLVPSH